MKYNIKNITTGGMDGKIVYISHFNKPDFDKKPIRNLSPRKVIILSNDELPKNKRINYSESHFRAVSKAGKVLSTVYPVFDNTGYRARTGELVNVYSTMEECVLDYNCDVRSAYNSMRLYLKSRLKAIDKEMEDLLVELK